MRKRAHESDTEPDTTKTLLALPAKPMKRKPVRLTPPPTQRHYEIRFKRPSMEYGSFIVTLSAPEAEEECPLTLDAIAASSLEFMPDVTFLKRFPNLKKMTLPCGHSFAAMPLFYHMCKNNQLCPCCRRGEEGKICADSIPQHFRERFLERIVSQDIQQRLEEEEDTLRQIINAESYHGDFQNIANQGHLHMAFEFTDIPSDIHSRITSVVFNVGLEPLEEGTINGGTRTVFRPLSNQMRVVAQMRNISDLVEISIQMHVPGLGSTRLETTGRLSMRGGETMQSYRGHSDAMSLTPAGVPSEDIMSISTFDIDFGSNDSARFIRGIGWRPDSMHVRWMVPQP